MPIAATTIAGGVLNTTATATINTCAVNAPGKNAKNGKGSQSQARSKLKNQPSRVASPGSFLHHLTLTHTHTAQTLSLMRRVMSYSHFSCFVLRSWLPWSPTFGDFNSFRAGNNNGKKWGALALWRYNFKCPKENLMIRWCTLLGITWLQYVLFKIVSNEYPTSLLLNVCYFFKINGI